MQLHRIPNNGTTQNLKVFLLQKMQDTVKTVKQMTEAKRNLQLSNQISV